ncbi:MAG: hypothetical protein K2W92_01140 [Alphaproteobacteria bacterium]|nr:hypothetical protein [Alphaproteobacteria bacterium]
MLKIIRIAFIISLFYLNQAFCYNTQLLEFNADSFNECIWCKTFIPIRRIQQNLDFLDSEKDESYVKKYNKKNIFNEYEEKISRTSDKALMHFFDNCKKIHNFYDEIDPFSQAAVQMLFERVFQKYENHSNLLLSTKHLLPVINTTR